MLDNAVRYGHDGRRGRARPQRRQRGRSPSRDDGAGRRAGGAASAIFEPGARGAAGRATQGAGLGLALARRLARTAGGDVIVSMTAAAAPSRSRCRLHEGTVATCRAKASGATRRVPRRAHRNRQRLLLPPAGRDHRARPRAGDGAHAPRPRRHAAHAAADGQAVDGHRGGASGADVRARAHRPRAGRSTPTAPRRCCRSSARTARAQLAAPAHAERHFDVVHVHNPVGAFLPALAAVWSRAPVTVGTMHSVVPEGTACCERRAAPCSTCCGRLDARIAVSRRWSTRSSPSFPELDVDVIPNGVDTTFFSPDAPPLGARRRQAHDRLRRPLRPAQRGPPHDRGVHAAARRRATTSGS